MVKRLQEVWFSGGMQDETGGKQAEKPLSEAFLCEGLR